MRGEKATGQNACGTAEEIRSQGRGREGQRNRVRRVERGGGEGLDADGRQRQHREVRKTEQNRQLAKQIDASRERVPRRFNAVRAARERVPLRRQRREG